MKYSREVEHLIQEVQEAIEQPVSSTALYLGLPPAKLSSYLQREQEILMDCLGKLRRVEALYFPQSQALDAAPQHKKTKSGSCNTDFSLKNETFPY